MNLPNTSLKTLNEATAGVDSQYLEYGYFAGGCFWGVEFYLNKLNGVLFTQSGFSGGYLENPTYEDLCNDRGDHAETVMVIFDTRQISFLQLVKYFFEIHDFTQYNRQGVDVGIQYRSAIFFVDEEQKRVVESVVMELKELGYVVTTEVSKFKAFYPAELKHQNYYQLRNQEPSCHVYRKVFR